MKRLGLISVLGLALMLARRRARLVDFTVVVVVDSTAVDFTAVVVDSTAVDFAVVVVVDSTAMVGRRMLRRDRRAPARSRRARLGLSRGRAGLRSRRRAGLSRRAGLGHGVAPGYGYRYAPVYGHVGVVRPVAPLWVPGYWGWNSGVRVWIGGSWGYPPYAGWVWVHSALGVERIPVGLAGGPAGRRPVTPG